MFALLLVVVSLFAGWSVWYATPAGMGLTNDSAAYLGGARSILAGTGYSDIWLDSELEPITHYPPLLSLTLSALSGVSGLNPYRAARVLHIILFAASTALMGLLGKRLMASSGARFWHSGLALLPALLFAFNADLLRVHAQVLSEPLFLFFSLLAFLAFDFALRPGNSPSAGFFCLLSGLFSGLAFLTRYSGLALIATFLAAIVLLAPAARLRQAAFFLAGALPPMAAWFGRNALLADSVTNRVFHFNPLERSNLRVGLWNTAHFLLPLPGGGEWLFQSGWLPGLLLAGGTALLAWLGWRAFRACFKRETGQPLTFVTALYVFGYLGAVLFSMSFFDASTKFQPRILAPLYVTWMLLLTAGLGAFVSRRGWLRAFAAGVAGLALALSGFGITRELETLRAMDGLGYASWRWRQAEVLTYLRRLPPEIAIYTNSPPAVYHVTGRASRIVPSVFNPVSGLPRTDYEESLAQMRADLFAGRAVLALFEVSSLEEAFGPEVALQFEGLPLILKAQGHALYGKLERVP